MSMTLGERVKMALAGPPKLTQKALAEACGVSPVSVNDWVHDRTQTIEGANLLNAAQFLQVNARWLAEGVGAMRQGNFDQTANQLAPHRNGVHDLTPNENAVVAKKIVWPFILVSPSRLADLRRDLGRKLWDEAIHDIDEYLDVAVMKWERKVTQVKSRKAG